ncbi:MAG: DUF47 family protein [Magnetococcales bacterium]|nr:DUF47 family protein [Magnetococcales bacterium]
MSGTSTSGKAAAPVSDGPPVSLLTKILNNVFPKVPDFFSLLNDQCEVVAESMETLVAFMETGDAQKGVTVRELEKRGDEIKARNLAILAKAFATPLDREDIYRAITSIDEIANYAKTTVREVEALQLTPDPYMLEMAKIMSEGTTALKRGYSKLAFDPLGAVEDERAVHQSEYTVETCYRKALAALLDASSNARQAEGIQGQETEARLMMQTITLFKHRELYRHMSNLGDRVAVAGSVLYDIMVQL